MEARRERDILAEFLILYSDFPCLWDMSSDEYKDRNLKSQAWELLAEKLKEIDPDANVATTKKKIEHMRTAYKREEKKIKESIRTGSGTGNIHVPNLWYFNLLSPVLSKDGDEEYGAGVEIFAISDDDTQPSQTERNSGNRGLKRKKPTLTKGLLQRGDKKLNSFVVYVGEQLRQVDTFQRQVAEKLISEVLFLAKTGNLNFYTKIGTPAGAPRSTQYIVPSPSSQYRPSQPTQLLSRKFITSSSSSRISTTKQNDNVIQISIPEEENHTNMSTSSYDSPSPLLQYILSSSHLIQTSSPSVATSKVSFKRNDRKEFTSNLILKKKKKESAKEASRLDSSPRRWSD